MGAWHPTATRRVPAPESGFTLIEVIMTIVILGIVAALGVSMMGGSIEAYVAGRDHLDADWRARVALERMTRELRAVRTASAADLDSASAGQIRFNDKSGNAVCFYLVGTTLMRSSDFTAACGTTNPQALTDGVNALAFSYRQNDPNAVALTPAQVRFITAQFDAPVGASVVSYRATVGVR
jgi:MSHA biogenesis protein MshO